MADFEVTFTPDEMVLVMAAVETIYEDALISVGYGDSGSKKFVQPLNDLTAKLYKILDGRVDS
jgi:hypothetical protein